MFICNYKADTADTADLQCQLFYKIKKSAYKNKQTF